MDSETDERSEAFERGLKTMERVALELYQRGRASAAEELESVKRERDEARASCPDCAMWAERSARWHEDMQRAERERDEWRDKFLALNQTAGELCGACGWAFKIPGESCRCEVVKERDEARASAAEAYKRGAEAMREACAARIGSDPALLMSLRSHCESALRALPIPEDK